MNDIGKAIEILEEITMPAMKMDAIHIAVQALEEKLNGGWIPVRERLPSEEECNKFDVTHPNARKFLCTIKVANYEPQVRTIYFSEIVGWKYSAQDYNEYVLAWQPLPKPYKEVEQ